MFTTIGTVVAQQRKQPVNKTTVSTEEHLESLGTGTSTLESKGQVRWFVGLSRISGTCPYDSHNRLLTKHHETFWIEVENEINDGKEYFRYKQVEHTKNPNVGQFDVLLEQNLITVDLLLCRQSGNGDTYSFKIKKKGMPLLFPESITYNI